MRRVLFIILFTWNIILAFLPDVQKWINLLGSTTAPFVVFILPGFLYYDLKTQNGEKDDKHRLRALYFAISGLFQIGFFTSFTLFNFRADIHT